jgi:ABC-type phosphate/phosphonate transport system substrate-binding protein
VLGRWVAFSVLLAFPACAKTCVGPGELGSKERPLIFALEGWPHAEESGANFQLVRDCLEDRARYRTGFEIHADVESVVDSVLRQEAVLGVVRSASFVSIPSETSIEALYTAEALSGASDRSVVVVRNTDRADLTWSSELQRRLLDSVQDGTVAYFSQDSDVGFLIGRQLLFEQGVLPAAAVFTSSWDTSLDLLTQGRVQAAIISEAHLRSLWGQDRVDLGFSQDRFVVVDTSPPVPSRVVVAHKFHAEGVIRAIIAGLAACASSQKTVEPLVRIFGGAEFKQADLQSFAFLRRVHEFQSVFVRIIPDSISQD